MGLRFGQSRSRLVLGVMCLVVAALAVGLVYVPGEWLARAGDALQAAITYLLSFGERSLLFALGAVLATLGLVLVILPRRRSHAYWAERPAVVAPVSVYVDAENQLQNAELVRPFVRHLRKYLDEKLRGKRADLLYFANAMQPQTRATYKELYRFGFRPIDVPHVPFEDEEVKDAVDMELSLHAFDRGLHGGERQHFIFVTGDRDFLPLIYRMHALGHSVQIWAEQPPKSFRELARFLDHIRVVDLREILRVDGQPQAPATTHGTARDKSLASLAEPISMLQAIMYTQAILHDTSSSHGAGSNRIVTFRQLLGGAHHNFLSRLGFDRGRRTEDWLEVLIAMGALQRVRSDDLPISGSVEPAVAAQYLEQFLHQLAAVLIELASQSENHTISWNAAAQRISAEASANQSDGLRPLRAMVAPSTRKWQAYIGHFCRCARALDLISFEEVLPGTAIRVDFPGEGEQVAADGAPDHGMAGEMVVEKSLVMRDEAGDTGTS